MDERKVSKSTNIACNKRMSTDSSFQLERAAWKNGGAVLFLFRTARGLRALRFRARPTAQDHEINNGPQPISLKVQHTNPGLACAPDKAQIGVPGSGKRIGNMSSHEVSKDRQRLRRFLSCLPASKPDFSTPCSQFLSLQNHLFFPFLRSPLKADCRFSHSRITSS